MRGLSIHTGLIILSSMLFLSSLMPVAAQPADPASPISQTQTFYETMRDPAAWETGLATYASDHFTTKLLQHESPTAFLFCGDQIPSEVTVTSGIDSEEFVAEYGFQAFQDNGALMLVTTESNRFYVETRFINEQWKIDDVTCADTPGGQALDMLVTHIGGWFSASSLTRDNRYRESGFFTENYINYLDEHYPQMHSDPLICAQALPGYFAVQETFINQAGDEALVVVRTTFDRSDLYMYLQPAPDGGWLIDHIVCDKFERSALYWAVDYMRNFALNNPAQMPRPYVPLFDGIPTYVEVTSVSGGFDTGEAVVELMFEAAPSGVQPVTDPDPICRLSLLQQNHDWIMTEASCPPISD